MALGIHLHSLTWEMAAALAPTLAETHRKRCLGEGGLSLLQQQLPYSQMWRHSKNTIP